MYRTVYLFQVTVYCLKILIAYIFHAVSWHMHNAQPDMGLRKNSAQRIRKTGKPVLCRQSVCPVRCDCSNLPERPSRTSLPRYRTDKIQVLLYALLLRHPVQGKLIGKLVQYILFFYASFVHLLSPCKHLYFLYYTNYFTSPHPALCRRQQICRRLTNFPFKK